MVFTINLLGTKQKEFVESFNEIKNAISTLFECDDSVYNVKLLDYIYDETKCGR
jgi:hypothetical protein